MTQEYNKFKMQLMADVENQYLPFTTETDKRTHKSFISLSAHYINANFDLKVALLGDREFVDDR